MPGGVESRSWKGEIHDFKNKINGAILSVRLLLSDLKEEKGNIDLMKKLEAMSEVFDSIHNLNEANLKSFLEASFNEAALDKKAKRQEYNKLLVVALEQAEQCQAIARDATRNSIDEMIDIIKSAQDFLSPTAIREAAPLKSIIDRLKKVTSSQLETQKNSIEIESSLLDTPVKGKHIELIESILSNCILNSNRFSNHDRFIITIEIEKDDVTVSIKDNGKGMKPDILDNVKAGIFGTTEGGHGIGLPDLYQQVQRMRGKMDVTSSTDASTHGTTFTWRLPAQSILEKAQVLEAAPVKKTQSTTVASLDCDMLIIVDDQKTNLKLFAKTIERVLQSIARTEAKAKDFQVKTYESFKEIKEMVAEYKNEISHSSLSNIKGIITDIDLGNDENGRKCLEELHDQLPKGIPLYTYSGNAVESEPEVKAMLEANLLQGHITKGMPNKDVDGKPGLDSLLADFVWRALGISPPKVSSTAGITSLLSTASPPSSIASLMVAPKEAVKQVENPVQPLFSANEVVVPSSKEKEYHPPVDGTLPSPLIK